MRFQKLGLFFACTFFICACVLVRTGNACVFSRYAGERAFYLYSPTSQATIKSRVALTQLHDIQGESVTITKPITEKEAFLGQVLNDYNACVLWEETCANTTSYYCYSSRIQGGVDVGGRRVNLHIAFGDERVKLGTPLIFGGF